MCGITGYVGSGDASKIVYDGLCKLEYRGYDSCGIAAIHGNKIIRTRSVGAVSGLKDFVEQMPEGASAAIGHTRWATHGGVNESNAHPHLDCTGKLAIVHNGIIENFAAMRAELEASHKFHSETDTEVLAHSIERDYEGNLLDAVAKTLSRVQGQYALIVIHAAEPETVVFARRQAPLLLAPAEHGVLIASDATAVLGHAREVIYLEDGDIGRIHAGTISIRDARGTVTRREPSRIDWTPEQAERGGFPHFMLKEIYECPEAVRSTILGRLNITPPHVSAEIVAGLRWDAVRRVRFLAIGSSHHAALAGKHVVEQLAGIPCEATLASEYRSTPNVEEKGTLAVVITQSGETADTLGALREAKRRRLVTLAVVNVEGSTATREADHVLLTRAGPEIGVASTKTYLAQVAALQLLAIRLGEATRNVDPRRLRHAANQLKQVPRALDAVLEKRGEIAAMMARVQRAKSAFFLGRAGNHAATLEAALKMKEISYIHAEGYSAGELKHGPFALLTKQTPVFCLVAHDGLEEKHLGTIQEVRARGSPVYAFALGSLKPWDEYCTGVVGLPDVDPIVAPLVFGLATHLAAYEVAALKGLPIDQPRNLAKSVTVE